MGFLQEIESTSLVFKIKESASLFQWISADSNNSWLVNEIDEIKLHDATSQSKYESLIKNNY